VKVVILENTVNAFFLHTFFAAAGAVFPELNRGILADGMMPWISGFNGYMILLGHLTLQFELMALDNPSTNYNVSTLILIFFMTKNMLLLNIECRILNDECRIKVPMK
jgi:hypothetical protein